MARAVPSLGGARRGPLHLARPPGGRLRFPRFLRVRDDKGPEDATNATQIAQMYNDQACTKGAAELEDEDDY